MLSLLVLVWGSYQMTMATIFRTASFKLWQKFTNALPLGPILPSIIPELKGKTIITYADRIKNCTHKLAAPYKHGFRYLYFFSFFCCFHDIPIVAEKITIPSTFMPSLVPGEVFTMTSGGGVRSKEKF